MMRILLLLLVFTASPCFAGKLFECRDTQGRVSFVDHGCVGANERREITLVEAPPVKKAATDADSRQIQAWDKASRSRLPASLGGSSRVSRSRGSTRTAVRATSEGKCAKARARKDEAYAERSLSMGFDERRKLSDAVLAACGLH